jgi:hypothetical protein
MRCSSSLELAETGLTALLGVPELALCARTAGRTGSASGSLEVSVEVGAVAALCLSILLIAAVVMAVLAVLVVALRYGCNARGVTVTVPSLRTRPC